MNTFTVDQSHSEIGFKVRHLGISSVKGTFKNYDVEIIGDSIDKLQVKFSAKVSSIDTSNMDRDAHLASGDFFNSDEYNRLRTHLQLGYGDRRSLDRRTCSI